METEAWKDGGNPMIITDELETFGMEADGTGTPGGHAQARPTSQEPRDPQSRGAGGAVGQWGLHGMEEVGGQGCLATVRPSEALAVLGLGCGALWQWPLHNFSTLQCSFLTQTSLSRLEARHVGPSVRWGRAARVAWSQTPVGQQMGSGWCCLGRWAHVLGRGQSRAG